MNQNDRKIEALTRLGCKSCINRFYDGSRWGPCGWSHAVELEKICGEIEKEEIAELIEEFGAKE